MIKGHGGRVVSTFIPHHFNHTCLSHATTPRLVSSRRCTRVQQSCGGNRLQRIQMYAIIFVRMVQEYRRYQGGIKDDGAHITITCLAVSSTSSNTCTPREMLISFPQREMMAAAFQWRAFTKYPWPSRRPLANRNTLSQCWPRSMVPPGSLACSIRGLIKAVSSRLILSSFSIPVTLPALTTPDHSSTCRNNSRGHPLQNPSNPAWVP